MANGRVVQQSLQGFTPAHLDMTGPLLAAETVTIGDTDLHGRRAQPEPGPARLAMDYVVHHRKANVSRVLGKLGLRDRTQADVYAYETGRCAPRRDHPS
jgi:hypothetical protein